MAKDMNTHSLRINQDLLPKATTSTDGLMSSTDKQKIDLLEHLISRQIYSGANNSVSFKVSSASGIRYCYFFMVAGNGGTYSAGVVYINNGAIGGTSFLINSRNISFSLSGTTLTINGIAAWANGLIVSNDPALSHQL